MIEKTLLNESVELFGELDRWNALFELKELSDRIIDHWLTIGTRRLRAHFDQEPASGWKYLEWGAATDTRWYLEEFGPDSLGIGFGWGYQFHLYLNDVKRFDAALMDQRLKEKKFAPLLMPFSGHHRLFANANTKAAEYYNFSFGSPNDGNIPKHELAWYAAHRTDEFVRQTVQKIDRFIRSDELTRLVVDLNSAADRQGKTKPTK